VAGASCSKCGKKPMLAKVSELSKPPRLGRMAEQVQFPQR
jgi:hypothetical protein